MNCCHSWLSVLAACGGGATTTPAVVAPAPTVMPAAAAAVESAPSVADPGATPMATVPAGNYQPLFPGRDGVAKQPVAEFQLELHPVANAQFLAFVAAVPGWRRSKVPALFADASYLADWRADLEPPADGLDRPVTGVSWFAAKAYAAWRHRRLPTLAEWELAAALPLADGGDPNRTVLAWYGRPAQGAPAHIGTGTVHILGLTDLHGLVWEWVFDFGRAMVTGDARGDTDLMRGLFCGAGAVGSSRPGDYPAFMRMALRSSLQGRSTTSALGFRCAADLTTRGN